MSRETDAFMFPCFLCRRQFQFGPHRYDGRAIPTWGVRFCDVCISSNHDGIVPEAHPELMDQLARKGVTVTLNARGWLPIPG